VPSFTIGSIAASHNGARTATLQDMPGRDSMTYAAVQATAATRQNHPMALVEHDPSTALKAQWEQIVHGLFESSGTSIDSATNIDMHPQCPADDYHINNAVENVTTDDSADYQEAVAQSDDIRCWNHDCNGRKFSSRSNFKRHCKERMNRYGVHVCFGCGAKFKRRSAREQHIANESCFRIRRHSNGRERPSLNTRFIDCRVGSDAGSL
jgi:hypothetical protein